MILLIWVSGSESCGEVTTLVHLVEYCMTQWHELFHWVFCHLLSLPLQATRHPLTQLRWNSLNLNPSLTWDNRWNRKQSSTNICRVKIKYKEIEMLHQIPPWILYRNNQKFPVVCQVCVTDSQCVYWFIIANAVKIDMDNNIIQYTFSLCSWKLMYSCTIVSCTIFQ